MKMKELVKEWLIPLAIALLIALLLKRFILFIAYVPTESMEPTVMPGERLLITRIYKPEKLKRGDIVVFNFEETDTVLIKRLIGLPGDRVKIIEGVLYINGDEVPEPYVENEDIQTHFDGEEIVVPDNAYFFLGDNRTASMDGRYWFYPFVQEKDIIGIARFTIFPFNKIRLLNNARSTLNSP